MNRSIIAATLSLCLPCLWGCPGLGVLDFLGSLEGLSARDDPKSTAADLAGRWCLQGEERGFFGFFELDETGDPVRLEDNPVVVDSLQLDTLILDGQPHTSAETLLEYTATASTTIENDLITIFLDIRVASFGIQSGALAFEFEGRRVANNRLEGIAVTLQQFPGRDVPELFVEIGTATTGGCD